MLDNLTKKWDKKYLLIIVALVCVALYFYGSSVNKDYLTYLPVIGGLAFGLNTLFQLTQ